MVMFEKRWAAVPPQLFTFDGTIHGQLTVSDSTFFKVKQQVILRSNTQAPQRLEIKRVINDTIYVGAIGEKIQNRVDISNFLVLDGATISADEQPRSTIPEQEIERLTYEEEPTVSRRVTLVDPYGNKFSGTNPLPVLSTGFSYDEIDLVRDSDGDITTATYLLNSQVVRVFDLFYDVNKNLIKVTKI